MEKKRNLWIISTDKPSRLWLSTRNENYLIFDKFPREYVEYVEPKNIYITSEKDIKDNDWIITKDGRLVQVSYLLSKELDNASKVILTTNALLIEDGVQPIPDEFLEWFINNVSCEEVEIYQDKKDYGTFQWYSEYKIIIPKEETKPKTMLESLQEYLKNTPKEKIIEDWNEFQHLDNEGITVKEFLENQKQTDEKGRTLTYWGGLEEPKQETLEKAKANNLIKLFGKDFDLEPRYVIESCNDSFIEGANWQQEQNKNLYNEEDLLNFGAFVRIEDKKEKRLFLIQDYYKKWLEKFKKK